MKYLLSTLALSLLAVHAGARADDGRTTAIRITTVGKKMLKMAQPGADEVDKQLLSLISSSERKSFIDNLAVLAAEMDRIEEKEPAKPVRKIKTRKRA